MNRDRALSEAERLHAIAVLERAAKTLREGGELPGDWRAEYGPDVESEDGCDFAHIDEVEEQLTEDGADGIDEGEEARYAFGVYIRMWQGVAFNHEERASEGGFDLVCEFALHPVGGDDQ